MAFQSYASDDPGYLSYYDPNNADPNWATAQQQAQKNAQVPGANTNVSPNPQTTGGIVGSTTLNTAPTAGKVGQGDVTPPAADQGGLTGGTTFPTTPQAAGAAGSFQFGSPNDPTKYTDSADLLGKQLNQGLTPQQAADAVNKYFNLQTGSQAVVYSKQGPNGTDIVSVPSGYYTNNSGTWTFNARNSGSTHPTGPMVTATGTVPPGNPYQPYTPSTQLMEHFPTYTPAQLSQFQAPDFSHIQGLQDQNLEKILTTPTLSPAYVSRLLESQKELAVGQHQDQSRAASVDAAHRGVAAGGAAQATQTRLGTAFTNQLLTGQRDIQNTAETTNRQGVLDALGASNATLGGRANIATSFYDSLLKGQQAQAGENGRGYQSLYDAIMAQENGRQIAGQQGLTYDQLLNSQYQFGQDLNYRYATANQNADMAYINYILNGGK